MMHIPERRRVIGNDHQLGSTLTQWLQRLPIAKHVLSTLHHQRQTRVYTLNCLFLLIKYIKWHKSSCVMQTM